MSQKIRFSRYLILIHCCREEKTFRVNKALADIGQLGEKRRFQWKVREDQYVG
jgi:hypothetical protein